MKKQYYIYFSLGVVAIFLLQTLYIHSLYQNFRLSEQQHIEDTIYEAIDLELHYRVVKSRTPDADVKYQTDISGSRVKLNQFPPELQEEIQKFLSTKPKVENEWVAIQELKDKGLIRTRGDIQTQHQQDWFHEEERFIDLHIIDSLFKSRIERNYKSKFCLLNEEEECVECIEGDNKEYNYTTRKFPIGLKNKQVIIAEVDIKPSYFIAISILTLLLSFLIVVLSLITLVYLITALRRKDDELKRRETNINGVIHDLKSPLVGVVSMLDLYHLMEQDAGKKEILRCNKQSVTLLCAKIEGLLITAKGKIEIKKKLVTSKFLQERVDVLIKGLRTKYSDKSSTVRSVYNNFREINIDVLCFDSIITNVVENALKYSNQDVEISVEITCDNNLLYVVVSDNGVGIAKRERRRIFDHLYQVPGTSGSGYGIGLTYVKAIARAHGGDARLVTSQLGVGSKFEVTINVK